MLKIHFLKQMHAFVFIEIMHVPCPVHFNTNFIMIPPCQCPKINACMLILYFVLHIVHCSCTLVWYVVIMKESDDIIETSQ